GRMREQAPHCSRDVSMLSTLYTAQITSDCRAFENDLRARLNDADNRLRAARAAVRDALEESFEHANRWNLGECVTEFRNCMVDRGGCEEDFSGCVGIAAAQSAAMSRRGVVAPRMHRVQIPGQNTFIEIAMSSYDTLVARGHLCENITDQCIMHKDRVWDIFVASVAPAVRTAEIMQESENRQNCISNISECFRRGCADRFNPEREEAEYDLCLTNPAAMVHICRVPLEACGITVDARQNTVEEDHPIWSFVTRRLSAMRDNACLREVRRCMTSENNCGEDYANCIGMDVAFIKRMCPLERMRESCIVDGEAMSASYYDDLIAGILMNIDNAQLRMCTAAVDARLGAMCTARDCSNLFENNNAVGASGIVVESNALTRTIKGLIDFSWIRVNPNPDSNTHRVAQNVVLPIIETVMVQDDETGEDKTLFADYTAAAETQRGINLMIRVINEKVDELVMDERVQMCIGGRRLRQVDGRSALGERTEARFPAIAHAATMTIINAGLQRAQVNHERRRRELIREGQTALERLAAAGVCYDPDLHGPPEWMRTDAGASGGD
ncbi:MAG: hypothetical protein FWE17_02910, partial [Alphaproteobacteria bacterium]|nr:hypothetical protein [Alphaproteobacteria bacterium]